MRPVPSRLQAVCPASVTRTDPEPDIGSQVVKRESPSEQLLLLAEAAVTEPQAPSATLLDRGPPSPAPSLIEVAQSRGTQTTNIPSNSWTTMFDDDVRERIRFWVQELDYKTRNVESHRQIKRASRGLQYFQYTRHVTVRSITPTENAARSLERERDWEKAKALALEWCKEGRYGVDVQVEVKFGSAPPPKPRLM